LSTRRLRHNQRWDGRARQVVYLAPDGSRLSPEELERRSIPPKQTFGKQTSALLLAVRNMGGESEAAWRGVLDDSVGMG
jgi:hypothetical protein